MEPDLNTCWKIVVDTIQDDVMIVDISGVILSLDRTFEKISGYSEEQILGQTFTTLNYNGCEITGKKKDANFFQCLKKCAENAKMYQSPR